MTNEQAIKWLKDYRKTTDFTMPQYEEAFDMAIEVLQEQADRNEFYNWDAPIRHKADGEYISRQAVTDTTICEGISCNECSFNTCEDGQAGCLLKERIDKLPSVAIPSAEPKTGHWIKYGKLYQCSECEELSCCQGKFCNECGARMVEPQESEE